MPARKALTEMTVPLAIMLACSLPGRAAELVPPAIGSGELRSVAVFPAKACLRGAGAVQQLVVTVHYADGGVRDLTAQAAFRASDAKVLQIEGHGLLVATGTGSSEVIAEFQGKSAPLAVTVEDADREQPINFA